MYNIIIQSPYIKLTWRIFKENISFGLILYLEYSVRLAPEKGEAHTVIDQAIKNTIENKVWSIFTKIGAIIEIEIIGWIPIKDKIINTNKTSAALSQVK